MNDKVELVNEADGLVDLIEVPDMDTPPELAEYEKQNEPEVIENLDEEDPKDEDPEPEPKDDPEPEPKPDPEPEPKPEPKHELSDEDYGKAVQKRISKEVGKRKAAEDRAAAAQAENDILREQLEKMQTSHKDTRVAELKKMRDAAAEEADLTELNRINDELLELATAKPEFEIPESTVPPEPAEPEEPEIHPSAQAWLDRNLWYSLPGNDEKKDLAIKIQNELLQSGMEFGDDLYSKVDAQLEERLKPTQPEPADPPPTGSKPGHISAPNNVGDPNPRPKKGQLSSYDISTMRQFNLDPNNPTHRKFYLKRKTGR